jgi:TatD DNase family protein
VLIDSHAHLNLDDFDRDRDDVITRARQAGLNAIINIGIDRETSRTSLELANKYDDIYAAVGIHPNRAGAASDDDIAAVIALTGKPKVVAIGEIGLDFYRKSSSKAAQEAVFRVLLAAAEKCDLPVIIHTRQAHPETLAILEPWAKAQKRPARAENRLGVIHCYDGSMDTANRYLELGFYISLTANVTYPSAKGVAAAARAIPLERLLVETDAPFLAPQLHRGHRNEPAFVGMVADKIGALKKIPAETVAQKCAENTIHLFGLPISTDKE